jgi:hypothetical protein
MLPDSVSALKVNAFTECTALVSADLPGVLSVAHGAFYKCANLEMISLPNAESITHTSDSANGAFHNCTALISLDLPKMKSIGKRAFYKCATLSRVNLPAAEEIGEFAFRDCTALANVSLPAVRSIGNNAFYSCGSLEYLILGDTPPDLGGTKVFYNGIPRQGILVPAAALAAYRNTDKANWTEALKVKLLALGDQQ